jgi:uncharacterized membrane protein
MRTKASLAGHPVHTILVPLPIGLFTAALVFDLIHVGTGRPGWAVVALWDIAAGIVGALVAAVPGLVDCLTLRQPVRRIGTWHLALNLTLVGVFGLNLLARTEAGRGIVGAGMAVPLALTVLGVALMMVSGWLGGEMVYVHRVGVQERGERAPRIDRRAA